MSSLGDVVFAVPAVESLLASGLAERVTWLVEDRAAALPRVVPGLDEVLVFPRRRRRDWPAFALALRRRRDDVVLDLQGNAKRMGQRLVDRLGPVVDATPWIAELRGRGLMQAIEMVQPDSIEPDAARAGEVLEHAKARGLLVGKGGLYGNSIRIAPMLNVTESEIDEGVGVLIESIHASN